MTASSTHDHTTTNGTRTIVHCVDSYSIMLNMPDNHFDLAVVDPPYGINETAKNAKRNSKGMKRDHFKDYGTENWDASAPGKEFFEQLFRISKHQIIFGANHFIENLPDGKRNASCWIVWDKVRSGDFADCELAWTSFPKAVRQLTFTWQAGHNPLIPKRMHLTQKPVELYEWIYRKYAAPGWTILDTHLGSGSSRIAAAKCGYDFTGYEISASIYEKHIKFFEAEMAQLGMYEESFAVNELSPEKLSNKVHGQGLYHYIKKPEKDYKDSLLIIGE